MTIPLNLQEDIESVSFLCDAGLASFVSGYIRNIAESQAVQRLARLIPDEVSVTDVLDRISDLAASDAPDGFANPKDAALAAYLVTIAAKAPPLLRSAAQIACAAPRLWWTPRVSARLSRLDSNPLSTSAVHAGLREGFALLDQQRGAGGSDTVWGAMALPGKRVHGLAAGIGTVTSTATTGLVSTGTGTRTRTHDVVAGAA
jgi:hypothetical protein